MTHQTEWLSHFGILGKDEFIFRCKEYRWSLGASLLGHLLVVWRLRWANRQFSSDPTCPHQYFVLSCSLRDLKNLSGGFHYFFVLKDVDLILIQISEHVTKCDLYHLMNWEGRLLMLFTLEDSDEGSDLGDLCWQFSHWMCGYENRFIRIIVLNLVHTAFGMII